MTAYIPKYIYSGYHGALYGRERYLKAYLAKKRGFCVDRRFYNEYFSPHNLPEHHNDFNSKLIWAIRHAFPYAEDVSFKVAKVVARRLRRKRNKYGIGLVGPIVDFKEGDEGKIAYSPKGVSRKNSRRRIKIGLQRFLKRNVLTSIPDGALERVQIGFSGLKFSILQGSDAASLYEGGGKFKSSVTSNQSCMQGTTYNRHLFEQNEGKYMLLIAEKGDTIIGRTKLFKNNDGTYFLGTRTYSCEPIEENFEDGPLNCTLNHDSGEEMPYIDETADSYGMDRVSSSEIRFHKHGQYSCNNTDGTDPSSVYCEKCGCGGDMEEIGDYYYCNDCANECFTQIDGEWYDKNECVYSECEGEYLVESEALSFITNEDGDMDYVSSMSSLFYYKHQYYHDDDSVLVDGEKVPDWLCEQDEDGNWRLSE
jgi:hypothetical protein